MNLVEHHQFVYHLGRKSLSSAAVVYQQRTEVVLALSGLPEIDKTRGNPRELLFQMTWAGRSGAVFLKRYFGDLIHASCLVIAIGRENSVIHNDAKTLRVLIRQFYEMASKAVVIQNE